MPLVSVANGDAPLNSVLLEGVQYITGTLNITGSMTVTFDGSLYTVPGDYVVFKYGDFVDGQNKLNQYVDADWVPNTKPDRVGSVLFIDFPVYKYVVARLNSAADNGTQYVQGNLNITGSPLIKLHGDLYGSPGTYTLFEVTGTITGEANLSGRIYMVNSSLEPGTPYKVFEDGVWRLKIELS